MEDSPLPAPPARFSDRLNAFLLDAGLFSSGYFLSASAVLRAMNDREPPAHFYAVWVALWSALFVLYHAVLSSDGRQSVGKQAFGLAVTTLDGEDVGFGAALLRACGYALSCAPLDAGFLWALRGDGRAWHDLLAGTRVVEIEPQTPRRRLLSACAAWGLALVLAASTFFLVVVAPGLARMKLLARARVGLRSLAYEEEQYKKARGVYTADVDELLRASPDSAKIGRSVSFYLNRATIRITADRGAYTIEAQALDQERTPMRVSGPSPPP